MAPETCIGVPALPISSPPVDVKDPHPTHVEENGNETQFVLHTLRTVHQLVLLLTLNRFCAGQSLKAANTSFVEFKETVSLEIVLHVRLCIIKSLLYV